MLWLNKRSFMLFFYTTITYTSFDPLLLDEASLLDSTKIQNHLINLGFKKVYFSSPDNIKLCGLLLDQSNQKKIEATILYCAGFYPGTKEGMSSFYALLADQPYNFLLFDARGHQESEGSLFSFANLKNYGSYEYQDVIGALLFLKKYNIEHNISNQIIIHGICSGAFHAIKAYNKYAYPSDINGIIFDSGWLAISEIAQPTLKAEIAKRFNNSYFSWLQTLLQKITCQFYTWLLKPFHETIENIKQATATTQCPIFFIHCLHDPYIPIAPIQEMTKNLNCPDCWWIDHHSHANFHTKQPELYAKKIQNFITKTINK